MPSTMGRTALNDKLTRDTLQNAIDDVFNKTLREMLNDGIITTHDFGRYSRATLTIKLKMWDAS